MTIAATTKLRYATAALIALAAMTGELAAAPSCATQADMAAFRTAAVQQQLMVAALTCHDTDAYNRFVIAYRPELQKSDADLKAYFVRRGSEAAYDTFKTKLANLSSLSDIANGQAYCANASAAFDLALSTRQSLASFVADQRLMIALPKMASCEARPVEASAAPAVKLAALHPPALAARPQKTVRTSEPASVVGVPSHALPASPYGRPDDAQALPAGEDEASADYDQSRQNDRADGDYADADLPPPPPPRYERRGYDAPSRDAYREDYRGDYRDAYGPRYSSVPYWWPRQDDRSWYDAPDDER